MCVGLTKNKCVHVYRIFEKKPMWSSHVTLIHMVTVTFTDYQGFKNELIHVANLNLNLLHTILTKIERLFNFVLFNYCHDGYTAVATGQPACFWILTYTCRSMNCTAHKQPLWMTTIHINKPIKVNKTVYANTSKYYYVYTFL